MNLRSSHATPWAYDAVLVLCGLVALGVLVLSLGQTGSWRTIGIVAICVLALLVYAAFLEPRILRVTRYRESLVPESRVWLRIAFLSDLHAGGFRTYEWYKRIVRETQALRPDIVVGGGDFVADLVEHVSDLSSLRDLTASLGKVFVLGNHDYIDRPQSVRSALASYGFADLTNGSIVFERDGAKLEVTGVDDHWRGDPVIAKRTARDVPRLVVAHEPDVCMDLKEGEADLVVTGHTHGGQVRLPFIGPVYPIPSKLGRAVDQGRKTVNGTRLIVSRGLGEEEARVRLFCPAEVVIVDVGI